LPARSADAPPPAGGERGVALVLVLWLLVLLAILVVGFSGDARTQLRLARNQHEAATAQAIADSGVAFAVLGVFDPLPATRWGANGRAHVLHHGGGILRISLQDEGGKIDLNVAPVLLISNLFQAVGLPNAQQLALAVEAARPRRPDNVGQSAAVEMTPAFAAVEELRRIPGMDRASYDRVAAFVTVYSGSPRFDPMTAPRAVLRPDEFAVLQPLGIERHADSVMPENLDEIAATPSEHIQIAGVRIALHCLLHLERQAIHPAPHIGVTDRQPHPHPARHRDHRRDRTFTTRASAAASTSGPAMIRSPPARTISIRPTSRDSAGAVGAASGVMAAGTNVTAPLAGSKPDGPI
jgi:general secretion pathway protein K